MMKGIVYAAREKSTRKFYIGVTYRSLFQRKRDHLYKAEKQSSNEFHKRIKENGINSFSWVVLDTANSSNNLAYKEKFYIKKYNSIRNGYNKDSGGGIKKHIYQYTKWGLMIMEHNNLHNAAWCVRGKRTSISNACLGYNKSYKSYYWSYRNTNNIISNRIDARVKKVVQMDADGKIISIYISVAEASKDTGISKTCIARCCRGERHKSGGYIWKYIK